MSFDYSVEHFQWFIGLGFGLDLCLVYKYSVVFSWFKHFRCQRVSPRVDQCATWVTWVTASWFVGKLSSIAATKQLV